MLTHTVFHRRYRMKYSELEEVDEVCQIRHPILRESLQRHWCGAPVEIASVADVPAGTGMGSSGAYTVCLLKGLVMARHSAISPVDLAEAACEIEMEVLGEPVGKQDPYVAAHGGICAYTFHPGGGVEVQPLELDLAVLRRLRDQLLLFYTGEARSASQILADQDERSKAGDARMIENLHHTKDLGLRIRQLLEAGDLEGYAELMHEHWERKRARSPGMSSEQVDRLYAQARRNGAIGGKLVGAGGGGFLLVYTRRPEDTRRAMAAANAPELAFDFEFGGAYASEYT
jgi:D-glycero-alpha-D-manno-heptose-7-phosphate kinase